jgi:hypothetical protein
MKNHRDGWGSTKVFRRFRSRFDFNSSAFPSPRGATITLGSGGTLTTPSNTTLQGLTTGSGATLTDLVTVSGGGSSAFDTNSVSFVAG